MQSHTLASSSLGDDANSPMMMVADNSDQLRQPTSIALSANHRHPYVGAVRQGMAETSLEAFHSLPVASYLQPKERAVMDLFTGPSVALTREQLAQILGWKEAAVCGRANSLVTKGQLVEIDGGKTASGRSAKLLKLPPQPAQASLLEATAAYHREREKLGVR